MERRVSVDILWIIVPVTAVALLAWLAYRVSRALGVRNRPRTTRQRVAETELPLHRMRDFIP
jgi:hypothetical protein